MSNLLTVPKDANLRKVLTDIKEQYGFQDENIDENTAVLGLSGASRRFLHRPQGRKTYAIQQLLGIPSGGIWIPCDHFLHNSAEYYEQRFHGCICENQAVWRNACSRHEKAKMIMGEAVTYAFCGMAVGITLGLIFHYLIYVKVVVTHFGGAWKIPFSTIGIILLLVSVSCVAAVYAPAKRIRNMAITATINEL